MVAARAVRIWYERAVPVLQLAADEPDRVRIVVDGQDDGRTFGGDVAWQEPSSGSRSIVWFHVRRARARRGTIPRMTSIATGLESAREAVSRYAWREAFDLFAAADAAEPLGPDDLDQMAECAWWIGKMRHCIALRERAYAAYLKAGNPRRAARVAIDLADHHGDLGEVGDGGGLDTAGDAAA